MVIGCSLQARRDVELATSITTSPFQRITLHSNLDSTACLVMNTAKQRAWIVKAITQHSPVQGIGEDVSAMPRSLCIISFALFLCASQAGGAALFLRTAPELLGLFCWQEVKAESLHLSWVQDYESSAPLPRVGTTLRHNLPSRAALQDQAEDPLHGTCPEMAPLPVFLPFCVLLPSCPYWCALGILP